MAGGARLGQIAKLHVHLAVSIVCYLHPKRIHKMRLLNLTWRDFVLPLFRMADERCCQTCGKSTNKRCCLCKRTFYCSADCCKLHWRIHRVTCLLVKNPWRKLRNRWCCQYCFIQTIWCQWRWGNGDIILVCRSSFLVLLFVLSLSLPLSAKLPIHFWTFVFLSYGSSLSQHANCDCYVFRFKRKLLLSKWVTASSKRDDRIVSRSLGRRLFDTSDCIRGTQMCIFGGGTLHKINFLFRHGTM